MDKKYTGHCACGAMRLLPRSAICAATRLARWTVKRQLRSTSRSSLSKSVETNSPRAHAPPRAPRGQVRAHAGHLHPPAPKAWAASTMLL